MPQVKIVARYFMDMVASLPAVKLDTLYDNSFICEAILRSLPPLAKKYVLQLLYIDIPISAKSMEEWVLPDGFSKHKVAIDILIQLRVMTETFDRKKEATYQLNPKFQFNLQKHIVHGSITGSGVLPREPMPSNITVRLPSLEELEAYAIEQWESEYNFGNSFYDLQLSQPVLSAAPYKLQDDREPPRLTESGFQFLLMDTNAQLWYIIREYITNAEERGVDSADLIAFLLELSFHVTGKVFLDRASIYNTSTLTDLQRSIIRDLSDLGLVKLQKGRKESWFIPTKLATNLSISLADTTSRKQIISFLQQNAHPRVAERIPSVPENVTDQDVFEAACDFAREYGGLLWEDSKRMHLIVKADILTEMKEFLRRQKQ
ncbi:hypothetical protein RND71_033478 [Anisodus tanguticus]|uniref:RNA polymerase II transcription factor B subunit 2 n=1 Tax=Anisodus tanguticus TaxID=243964 RepID=A0AAE1V399_9SOLA|nr:hypothetical protein RND71_033478 [Anisodus tanguticus]